MLDDTERRDTAWMSHDCSVVVLPRGFVCAASTDGAEHSLNVDDSEKAFGVQFLPVATCSKRDMQLLHNCICGVFNCVGDETMAGFAEEAVVVVTVAFYFRIRHSCVSCRCERRRVRSGCGQLRI